MPAYDYDCAACGRRFEVIHGVHADGPTTCPLCGGGPVRKAITAPAIHYKGSGWAKKERRSTAPSGASKAGSDGDTASEAGASPATERPTSGGSGSDTSKPAPAKSSKAGATSTAD
jgi:putative FmdB family regulatory protein